MLQINNLGYDSWQTIYFQRATVMVAEVVLFYALHLYVRLTFYVRKYIDCFQASFNRLHQHPRSKPTPQRFLSSFRQDC